MDLHHQPIIQAHGSHLGKHLSPKEFALAGIRIAGEDFSKQLFSFDLLEIRGLCSCGWPWSVAVQPACRKRSLLLRRARQDILAMNFVSSPVCSPRRETFSANPGKSGSTTESGRKVRDDARLPSRVRESSRGLRANQGASQWWPAPQY